MTREVYGIVHYPGAWNEYSIPDCAEEDAEYAYEYHYLEDNEAVSMTLITLNPDDHWRGWFFYNDMEDGDEACSYCCNTEEHLDLHWESNNAGGHYDCMRYEHVVNGRVVSTRTFKTGNATMFDDPVDILTHSAFENRLTVR